MFITKTKKSTFYQLTYLIDGKRTSISTKAIKISDAYKFMSQFKIEENVQNIAQKKI